MLAVRRVTIFSALFASTVFALPNIENELPASSRVDYFYLNRRHLMRRDLTKGEYDYRPNSPVEVPIEALNRKFFLHIAPANDIFTSTATVAGKKILGNMGYYQGRVMGATKSFVHVHINQKGDITGRFWETHDKEHFHIRPVDGSGRHMIFTEAIEGTNGTTHTPGTCGVNGVNDHVDDITVQSRSRRGVSASSFTDANKHKVDQIDTTNCEMALFADEEFVNQYGKDKVVNIMVERLSIAQKVMDNQVDLANNPDGSGLYDWKGTIGKVRVKLPIKFLDFYDPVRTEAKKINDLVKQHSGDTKTYLEQFSKYDWSPYCLAHCFTYLDFTGTLGLAWTGYPNEEKHNGGICQARYNDPEKGPMSLNAAWHSSLNFGNKQLEGQSSLVLAHEIGHNFGAQHDPEELVEPANGHYVMNKFAVSGRKVNNKLFSQTSVERMGAVMTDRAGCFKDLSEPACNNGIIEVGEVCDCGTSDNVNECNERDLCCKPGNCTGYKDGSVCSPNDPNMGGCCTASCQFVDESENQPCGVETECTKAGKCTSNPNQPCEGLDEPRLDNTFCELGLKVNADQTSSMVCENAKCSKSICLVLGLEECDASETFGVDNGCKVKCKEGGLCKDIGQVSESTTKVYFTNDIEKATELTAKILGEIQTKPAGAKCANKEGQSDSGVCDTNGQCIAADTEEDTLDELKRQYEQFKDTFLDWVNQNTAGVPRYVWLIIGGVLLIAICCAGCYCANKDEVQKNLPRKLSTRKSRGRGQQGVRGKVQPQRI